MAEISESDISSSCEDVSYHSTPMEVEEASVANFTGNLTPATLLKQLNPQHKNRLFSKILNAKDISNLVGSFLSQYVINREQFIHMFVQLFVDISAYQYIDVESYVLNYNLIDIVSYMEKSNNSILATTGKYIVKMPKHSAKCDKIGDFLETFVMLSSKEKILYETSLNIIFQVIEKMSASNLRNIKHTGVFIALKFQSGLLRISYLIGQKIERYQYALENEMNAKEKRIFEHKIEKFYLNSISVNKLMEFIYLKIFKKNWNHGDSKLYFMRNDCILEISKWIQIFPDRFLNNDHIIFVIEALKDNHSMVRLSAIKTLSDVICTYRPKINDRILEKMIAELSNRMNDLCFNVAINAVETLTLIQKFTKLPHTIRDGICKLIYYPNYPLAAAAGKFLIDRINHHITDPNDPEEFIRMLVFFEKKSIQKGIKNLCPYVIEVIIDLVPVLQDIPVYISILENYKQDEESVTILIKILTETVYQTFLGVCTLHRDKQIERKVDTDKVKKMTKQFIESIQKLESLIPSKKLLAELLVLIRDFGIREYNNNNNNTNNSNANIDDNNGKIRRKRSSTKK